MNKIKQKKEPGQKARALTLGRGELEQQDVVISISDAESGVLAFGKSNGAVFSADCKPGRPLNGNYSQRLFFG